MQETIRPPPVTRPLFQVQNGTELWAGHSAAAPIFILWCSLDTRHYVSPFSHSSHSSWLSPVDTSLYFSPLVGRGPVEQLMDPFVISCVGWMQGASRSVVTITHYEARKGVTVGGPHPCQVYRRMSGEVRLPPQSSFVTTPLVTPRSAQCAPRWPSVTRLHRHTHQQLVIACMWQCNVTWPLELQTNLREDWSFKITEKVETSAFKLKTLCQMGVNPR